MSPMGLMGLMGLMGPMKIFFSLPCSCRTLFAPQAPAALFSLPGSCLGVFFAWLQPCLWRQEPPGVHSQARAWERGG